MPENSITDEFVVLISLKLLKCFSILWTFDLFNLQKSTFKLNKPKIHENASKVYKCYILKNFAYETHSQKSPIHENRTSISH